METALEWEIEQGINEPIDFIFDEQHTESDYLQSIFTPLLEAQPPEIRSRFGNRPIHLDDKKSPPLQAADMFAWPFRRIAERTRFRKPVDEFLVDIFQGVPIRRREWDRTKLAEFLGLVRQQNNREGRLFAYEFETAARKKDVIYHQFNQTCLAKAVSGQTVPLLSIPAKEMGRFLLVHMCPLSDTVHLHRRRGDQCLAHLSK
jgi:hypothetical protein